MVTPVIPILQRSRKYQLVLALQRSSAERQGLFRGRGRVLNRVGRTPHGMGDGFEQRPRRSEGRRTFWV